MPSGWAGMPRWRVRPEAFVQLDIQSGEKIRYVVHDRAIARVVVAFFFTASKDPRTGCCELLQPLPPLRVHPGVCTLADVTTPSAARAFRSHHFGDRSGGCELLDDDIGIRLAHDRLDVGVDVPREHRELAWLASYREVLVGMDLELLKTVLIRALTGDRECLGHGREDLVEPPHLLVDRAEERLVACGADLTLLLRCIRFHREPPDRRIILSPGRSSWAPA